MAPTAQWTETDLAYFAGIIDGEGCFCLHDRGTHVFGSQLHVGNTDLRLLEWIRVRFGGSVSVERRSQVKHKQIWRWFCSADNLSDICTAVLPYLVVKRDRAELILAYRATLSPQVHSKRSTYDTPDHVKHTRRDIHSQLVALNRRGAS